MTTDNIEEYLGQPDFPKREDICAGELAAECTQQGVTAGSPAKRGRSHSGRA